MSDSLIQEGMLFHSTLAQKLRRNEARTLQISNFSQSISRLFSSFSAQILGNCRKFFRHLKDDQSQDQTIIFLSKYIMDILNQLSKKVTTITNKISTDVVEPLGLFMQNQKKSNDQALKKSDTLLYSIETNSSLLRDLSRNYEDNQLSLTKSVSQKQMLKDLVENEIDRCNAKWKEIKKEYHQLLTRSDSLNSARCSFTIKTQINTIKLINRLVGSQEVQDSLHQYSQMPIENESLSLELKDELRDGLGKLIILQEQSKGDGDWTALQDQPQKLIINKFICFFTSRSILTQQKQQFQQARALILNEMRWTSFFLARIKAMLHTQIQLVNVKFLELATLLKYIFAQVAQVQHNQAALYNMLFIAFKVRHKDEYLIAKLGHHGDFWANPELWERIVDYVKAVKFGGKLPGRQGRQWHNKLGLSKLFSRQMWTRNKGSKQRKMKKEKVSHQAKMYQILYEINYFLAKLQVSQQFIFAFMVNQTIKHDISKENSQKLLQFHYMNKMILTNTLTSNHLTRKLRHESNTQTLQISTHYLQQITVISVGKSIVFLPLNASIVQMLLVCKRWHKYLKPMIWKRYLIYESNHAYLSRIRLRLYRQICYSPFARQVYKRMVGQVAQTFDHSEIINLDARRSLGWDQKLRVQLVQVLRTYSYYHPDVGYLQGMNYLCQNILKLTEDTYICYSIFQYLMNNQFCGLYNTNFEGLRIKIYQFMRILQRERHELYEHLCAEKIEGEHFLLPWAITLWGEMSGDLSWVMWDGFILQGWRWWFKTCIWLMKILEPQLLKMNFQQLMKCFSDLHSSLLSYTFDEMNTYGIDQSCIKADIDRISVEEHVLQEIQKQYRLKSNMINEYLKEFYPPN